ncbi:MAG TPA: 2OG-Fe(II) oxygenase [Geminicoccaceae bacterium]|nr:2OG-Fe(II) oxygenase [Geminicoccaceae bacterium]
MSAVPSFQPGDPVPWFTVQSRANPQFAFNTVAGRYILLCFYGTAGHANVREALDQVAARRALFDDDKASFFGVSIDPRDLEENRTQDLVPGIRHFFDLDLAVSRLYGAAGQDAVPGGRLSYRPFWLLLDPMLRTLACRPLDAGGAHTAAMLDLVAALPPVEWHGGGAALAPVLVLPRVFDPAFCRRLIEIYEAHGGEESGFMRDVDGRTVGIVDHRHKRRADCVIEDEAVRRRAQEMIRRRLLPEIEKAFQFRCTRLERYIVACYDSGTGGWFRPHRDNTTKGTAHRKFAATINLNAEDYEGGELRFPEFGPRTYRAPTGGCVVFSCSLLHEATPVTRGRRYAFLPFLYDEAGARVRAENARFLAGAEGAQGAEQQTVGSAA